MIVSPRNAPMLNNVEFLTSFAAMRTRQMSRYLVQGRVRFCTMRQLMSWSREWAKQLPKDIDVVVGMPRSGLIVGNIVASELGVPLSTPELFLERQWWNNGQLEPVGDCRRALVVDDSINTGEQMTMVLSGLSSKFRNTDFQKAILLPHQGSYQQCDYYYKIVRAPRVFEWDIMHTKKYTPIAFDFDGVLCEDCAHETDCEESAYERFLAEAKPRYIPQYPIDYVISNRLEKYRPACEAWLERHNVKYRHLLLWDLPDKDMRGNGFARNKVHQVLRCRPKFFVESSFSQARQIALKTGVPVLCTDRMFLFG